MVNYIQGSGLPQGGALGSPWAVLKHKPVDYERVREVTKNTLNVSSDTLPSSEQGQIVPYLIGTRIIDKPLVMGYGKITPNYETHVEETTENEVVTASQASDPNTPGGANNPRGWRYDYFGEMPTTGWIPKASDYEVVKPGLLTFGGVIGTTYGARYIAGDWTATLKNHTVNTITTLTDYTLDLVLCLALGPNVQLRRILLDKEILWEGNAGDGTEVDTSALENQPLGKGFIFRAGQYNAEPDDYLVAKATDPESVPAYPGISYIILKEIKSGAVNNAQLKFEVTRLPNYFDTPAEVLSPNGYDMNLALAAYALIYEDWAGLGVLGTDIDLQSFLDAVPVLYAEKQNCSMLMATDNLQNVLRSLESQADSVIFANDANGGKITFRLFRDNVDSVGIAGTFNPSNIIDIQNYQRVDWTDLPTHFNVSYLSRPDLYETHNDVEQNPAQPPPLYRSRRVGNVSLIDTVCNSDAAQASMLQFMKRYAAPTLTMTLITNRDGVNMLPGDIIEVEFERYNIDADFYYVLKRREQADLESVALDICAYQYLNVTKFFAGVEASKFVAADTGAKDVPSMRVIEAPYFILKKMGVSVRYLMPYPYGEAIILAEAANEYQSSFAVLNNKTKLVTKGLMNFAPTAQLVNPLPREQGMNEGIVYEVRLKNFKLEGRLMATLDEAAQRRGDCLIFLNDEILTYSSIERDGDEYVMRGVQRALIDTVEGNHAADDMLYFWNVGDTTRFWQGGLNVREESRDLLAVSSTLTGQMNIEDAHTVEHFEPYGRAIMPLRPHRVTVNGLRDDARRILSPGDDMHIEWRLRTRGDRTLTFVNDGNDVPEVRLENTHFQRSPVVFITLVDSTGVRHYLGNSLANLESGDYPNYNPAVSTLTYLNVKVPSGLPTGNARLELVASDYDYYALDTFEQTGELNRINQAFGVPTFNLYIEPEPAFFVDFDFDYATKFAADFEFEWLVDILF